MFLYLPEELLQVLVLQSSFRLCIYIVVHFLTALLADVIEGYISFEDTMFHCCSVDGVRKYCCKVTKIIRKNQVNGRKTYVRG